MLVLLHLGHSSSNPLRSQLIRNILQAQVLFFCLCSEQLLDQPPELSSSCECMLGLSTYPSFQVNFNLVLKSSTVGGLTQLPNVIS